MKGIFEVFKSVKTMIPLLGVSIAAVYLISYKILEMNLLKEVKGVVILLVFISVLFAGAWIIALISENRRRSSSVITNIGQRNKIMQKAQKDTTQLTDTKGDDNTIIQS